MKKYLYLLAGLAAGFVLVFMGTAICQYLHLTQSGYVRYDDSVEVVYQQVAEYAGVDPATLSIHAKRQVGDDIFVLWKTPDRTEVSMTQLRQASFGGHTYLCPEAGLLARKDDDPDRLPLTRCSSPPVTRPGRCWCSAAMSVTSKGGV